MALSEKKIQAVLMRRAMEEQQHEFVLPNARDIYYWESDLLTMTKTGYIHEYEIKCSIYDYRAEFKNKKLKHKKLVSPHFGKPNYFWFVTYDFTIRPPKYTGWIYFTDKNGEVEWEIKKKAPLLCKDKLPQSYDDNITRILSFRLTNLYNKCYLNSSGIQLYGDIKED